MTHDDIADYLLLRIAEADAHLQAAKAVITHPTSRGTTGEQVLKQILESFLPSGCEITSGFVVTDRGGALLESRQIDLMIYDRLSSAPLYRTKSASIVTPDMLRIAIESKLTLNKSKLREAITNVHSVKHISPAITSIVWSYSGMTLKTLKNHLRSMLGTIPYDKWPDQIFNLEEEYVVTRHKQKQQGVSWTACLGKGFVVCSLLQSVFFSANVSNLTPFLAKLLPEKTELF